MDLTSSVAFSALCCASSLSTVKRRPRRAKVSLPSAVKKIKSVLKSGTKVYLCSRSETYSHRIFQVRVASFGEFLRVKTAYGWSTVWYSEFLVDESGGVLFTSAEYGEVDDAALGTLLDLFMSDFAILPWHKGKPDVKSEGKAA